MPNFGSSPDDLGDSIVVRRTEPIGDAHSESDFSRPSSRAGRREVSTRMDLHQDDFDFLDGFERRTAFGPRPSLSIPKSWRDPSAKQPSSKEPATEKTSLQPQDQTPIPGEPPRGRKRKALLGEDRERSNHVRRLGACDNCRKSKKACSPSHKRGEGHRLRPASATYQTLPLAADVTAQRSNRAEPEVISNSTATSLYEEPISRKDDPTTHRVSTRAADIAESAVAQSHQGVIFDTDPSSISDIEIRTRHTALQKFGQSLNATASSIFPITSPSKYNSVHVLLLRWQDDDLGVSEEANKLAEVFSDLYHFEVTVGVVPSDSPSRWLSRKILNFVELEEDSRQTLKIVWYGGHSFISDSKQCMWSNDCRFSSTVSWQGCQSLLEEAQSDVLLLLDACGVGNASSSVTNGATEVITAGGWYGAALPEVGPFSFTTALTTELRQLSTRESFTVEQLYQYMLARIQSQLSSEDQKRRHPTPFHFLAKREGSLTGSISLCPLVDVLQGDIGGSPVGRSRSESGDDRLHPGMALTIKFKDSHNATGLAANQFVDQYLDQFTEWLRAVPLAVDEVKVEAGYGKF